MTVEQRIAAAVAAGPAKLLELWRGLQRTHSVTSDVALQVAEALIAMARPDVALGVLEHAGNGVRTRQLRALATAKSGRIDEAIEALAALRHEGHLDAESGGLLGGCYKQRGLAHDNRADLEAAYQVYLATYAASGDSYPGINAASLALVLGETDESVRIATEVLAQVTRPPERMTSWLCATRGEAHLLLGDLPNARVWYRRAVGANPNAVRNIATMRSQARINLGALGLDEKALDDVLVVRAVVAFTGHMIDAADRAVARFPPHAEGPTRLAIRERLKRVGAGFGFGSVACGADVLFLEELLGRGADAHVFLPYAYDRFVESSVAPEWRLRVDRILADSRVTSVTLPGSTAGADMAQAHQACADAIIEAAVRFATDLKEESILLAVWDGRAGDDAGGTADMVRSWERRGHRLEVIAPGGARSDSAPVTSPVQPSTTRDIGVSSRHRRPTAGGFQYAHRHCLCIGIGGYQHRPWKPLENARHDAEAVGQAFVAEYGFSDPLFLLDADATTPAIAGLITGELQQRAGPDDLVVVYFAGHGHTKRMGGLEHGFIVPVDAKGDAPGDMVSVSQLTEWSAYLECRHLLYIFDSCFSGMFQRMSGADRMNPDVSRARLAITSGQADQKVLDGGGTSGHSVFASGLLSALHEGIAGNNAYTATELYSYLRRRVTEKFPEQTPTLATLRNHEGGEILFQKIV